MIEINPSPMTTPMNVTKERATMAPTKTDSGRPVLEVMRIAANCVLSPNSARKMVPKVVIKIFQSMVAPLFYLEPSAKMFLSSSDRNLQPVFFRGKGTGVFFIICAEGVIGPIEIDQHLPSWHRFDKEITPLRIGFRSGGLSLKRMGEFPPSPKGL